MDADLALALDLADVADALTLPRFRAIDLAVETKPDLTPVSEVDRGVERTLRKRIERERPGDAVLGEEYGAAGPAGGRRWILDPIDGTKNFVRGIPIWGTLIALERDGDPAIGVASLPALGRRWWAARGAGAYADGAPIRVSRVARLEEAVFSFSRSGLLEGSEGVRDVVARVWHARTFSDCWQHLLVAEGAVDAAVDHVVSVWDLAALKVIVEEAGGRFSDLAGNARIDGGSAVTSNGLLHEEVLRALS